ncbi:Hypothetical protein SMAX5B_004946 [Scophthalmus maximus]|uniref:Uncharacterized protein n=1 Tax=Scophthalmus maximus TaxID=52904 RepID=A0A2U9BQA6_SCOMX|nr:Hypothetical protein SMAX5B_004946 [Scophthalmus maximus]
MLLGEFVPHCLSHPTFVLDSYAIHDHERLNHGRQLKIFLSKNCEKLEFIPADDPTRTLLYWENGRTRMSKGRVSGTGSDRRWYLDKVTYEDQGTYIQRDYWKKEISTFKVAVLPKLNFVKCVAGESLYVSLEGIDLADAYLAFSGEAANVTLVRHGAPVSQDLPDYWNRVQTHSMNIEIRHVNYTDQGHYFLRDSKGRKVSVTRMDLTDHHENTGGNPLMALLLLLGIPAGICCCCRKKIFKKTETTTATLQTSAVHPPPGNPVGPSPPYTAPGHPGGVYSHGPNPSMGYNPAYPPQNLPYPTPGPAMGVPAQPPYWNGPPPGQYPPGPGAPMGYAPVMYSAPPPASASEPVKEEVKMENMGYSPADPLLTATAPAEAAASPEAPVPPSSTNTLSSSEVASTFKIDGANSFL